jgi:transcriptional regulator with XRE-family HTH domain
VCFRYVHRLSLYRFYAKRKRCNYNIGKEHIVQLRKSLTVVCMLGDAISTARKRAGLTQAAVASGVVVAQATVSDWERNIFRPSDEILAKLEELLELPKGQLLVNAGIISGDVVLPPATGTSFSTDERFQRAPAKEQARIRRVVEAMLDDVEADLD